jgi:glycosyltransferase involved in cell wall biosynthesis
MHIVHGIAGISRAHGGTSTFVVELANAQATLPGNRVTLVTSVAAVDDLPVSPHVTLVHGVRPQDIGRVVHRLHRAHPIDLIHAHGLWQMHSHSLAQAARADGIPFVLATHGMLEAGAIRLKKWRKRAAMICYQHGDLVRADALSATAALEARNIRTVGFRQPILVAAPGVTLPAERRLDRGMPTGPRTAAVLARIHPVKNLTGLVAAWARVRPPGWRLVISGPDANGHADHVRESIRQSGLENECSVIGPQYGDDKARLFDQASLFVLPSFSENFGIVVAEALSYGVPVIATTGTPWEILQRDDCGWWVDPSPESLATALRAATSLPPGKLGDMGSRGRAVAERHFQWSRIAALVQAGYAWLIDGGPVPPSMQLATPG